MTNDYDWSIDDVEAPAPKPRPKPPDPPKPKEDALPPVLYRTNGAELPVIAHPTLRCPYCGATDHKIRATRRRGGVRVRYYVCRGCNRRFCSEEVV